MKNIDNLYNEFISDLKKVKTIQKWNEIQSKYLGKNSVLSLALRNIRSLSLEEKKALGKSVHEIKIQITVALKAKRELINKELINEKLLAGKVDITLPGLDFKVGNMHPLYMISNELIKIFTELGYDWTYGNEVDEELYNFELLNIGKNHPARNMHDTFYLSEKKLLRTHCTNATAKMLSSLKPDD